MDRSFLYRDGTGAYRWRRQSQGNNEIVAGSTEGFVRRLDAISNYERVSGSDAPELEDLTDVETAED